jgi:hypothetical protein
MKLIYKDNSLSLIRKKVKEIPVQAQKVIGVLDYQLS